MSYTAWSAYGGVVDLDHVPSHRLVGEKFEMTNEQIKERKFCIATIHEGTEYGIFLSGSEDERLSWNEATEVVDNYYNYSHITYDEYLLALKEELR